MRVQILGSGNGFLASCTGSRSYEVMQIRHQKEIENCLHLQFHRIDGKIFQFGLENSEVR